MSENKVVSIFEARGRRATETEGLGSDPAMFANGLVPEVFSSALNRVGAIEQMTRAVQHMLETVPPTNPKPGFFAAESIIEVRKQKVAHSTVADLVMEVAEAAPRHYAGIESWLRRWGMGVLFHGSATYFTLDIGADAAAQRIFRRKHIID
jgi:hypothetical protein